jgi:hypothetical protein
MPRSVPAPTMPESSQDAPGATQAPPPTHPPRYQAHARSHQETPEVRCGGASWHCCGSTPRD